MFVSSLKRSLIILLISVSAFSVSAQEKHFVYVQTENSQPFYVRLNNKLISSSPAGYIILPNLNEGDYKLVVGFPKNEFREESFQVSIDKKNQGFLLKDFGEKGWGLFNMQSLALLVGSRPGAEIATTTSAGIEKDPFSQMLASVVKDSSILEKHEAVVTATGVTPEKGLSGETSDVVAGSISIKKVLSTKDQDGMQMIYVDENGDRKDTVRIFIPAEKDLVVKTADPVVKTAEKEEVKQKSPPVDLSQLTITPTVIPDSDTVTLVNDTIRIYKESAGNKPAETNEPAARPGNGQTATPVVTMRDNDKPKEDGSKAAIIILPRVVTSSSVNSDCKEFAKDDDFLRLRKKMAAENSIDAMIRVARKVFHTKCFSTEQIRNLSYLFLSDEGKYRFFDAAYAFTSDSDQYQLLAAQLTDPYYIKRFNAMLHK